MKNKKKLKVTYCPLKHTHKIEHNGMEMMTMTAFH